MGGWFQQTINELPLPWKFSMLFWNSLLCENVPKYSNRWKCYNFNCVVKFQCEWWWKIITSFAFFTLNWYFSILHKVVGKLTPRSLNTMKRSLNNHTHTLSKAKVLFKITTNLLNFEQSWFLKNERYSRCVNSWAHTSSDILF